jgi:hypothetical protein
MMKPAPKAVFSFLRPTVRAGALSIQTRRKHAAEHEAQRHRSWLWRPGTLEQLGSYTCTTPKLSRFQVMAEHPN